MPKKYKFRKEQRGKVKGKSKSGVSISFGDAGLKALSTGFISSRQIEAARVCINRVLKRQGKLWMRIFPHKPYTKRPAETRGGSGKGDVDHYIAVVQPGRILFEVGGVSGELAAAALRKAGYKLPVKTIVVMKNSV